MRKYTAQWFEAAKDDLRKARDVLGIEIFDVASFLCQQAVEKALKSVLIETERQFPRTHDLVHLGGLTGMDYVTREELRELTLAYKESRYPLATPREYSRKDAERYIGMAEAVLEWTAKKLS